MSIVTIRQLGNTVLNNIGSLTTIELNTVVSIVTIMQLRKVRHFRPPLRRAQDLPQYDREPPHLKDDHRVYAHVRVKHLWWKRCACFARRRHRVCA